MSEENVEIVRKALDAISRGDMGFLDDYTEMFESVRAEQEEFIDAGEHVVVSLVVHVRGRDGVEASANSVQVWTIREGATERVCMYQEREQALEAAGLAE